MEKYILGLDIGVNSVGWAVLDCKESPEGKYQPSSLDDLNSYIFQSGIDENKDPRNAIRRQNRLARRQITRRAGRRRQLIKYLKKNGLLPESWDPKNPENARIANAISADFADRAVGSDDDRLIWSNPFAMRAFGLDHDLRPHELGCVLLHLQKRRGYFSNRGAKYLKLLKELGMRDIDDEEAQATDGDASKEGKERKKETRVVLDGIKELQKGMEISGCRTLGEYVWKLPRKGRHVMRITRGEAERVNNSPKKMGQIERIGYYAKREMVEDEFEQLRQRQRGSAGLSDTAWADIQRLIFVQFPTQSPPPPGRRLSHLRYNTVGVCGIFPEKKRTATARLEMQEFRTRAVIANIEANGKKLRDEQKEALFNAAHDPSNLNQSGRFSWKKVKPKSLHRPLLRLTITRLSHFLQHGLLSMNKNTPLRAGFTFHYRPRHLISFFKQAELCTLVPKG